MQVLVADDDPTSRLLLKAIVTRLGHECLVTDDGSSAWRLLESRSIDVLLTDWMMPGLDGPELCRQVRHEPTDGYVYIVLTTGLDHPEHVLEGMSAGADDYLIKPVDSFAVQTRLIAAERVTGLHRELERVKIKLLEQSRTDELTGLGNRRRMEEDVARAHARALRSGRNYGIALFDVDHFKCFNDHYGHIAGDETLRRVASCIDLAVRAGECAYRYGGEEFLLLMPDCSPYESIYLMGERIRRTVEQAAIPHESRPSEPPLVTLSGGVSCWTPDSSLSPQQVIKEADDALFEAKAAGRNTVMMAVSLEGQIDEAASRRLSRDGVLLAGDA